MSSVRHADRILVLDGGRLVESGNHETLVAQGGVYSRLLQGQIDSVAEKAASG